MAQLILASIKFKKVDLGIPFQLMCWVSKLRKSTGLRGNLAR